MNPRPSRRPLLRHGLIGTAGIAALILLAVFHSVVVGAVDRAGTERRAAIQLEAAARSAADARFAAPVLAVHAPPRMPQPYAPRNVTFRPAN